jgi:hypothetical protein
MIDAIAPPPPSLRLVVDTDALAANWRALDRLSGAARAGAAIKADCYGLGVATCLPALRDAGLRAVLCRRIGARCQPRWRMSRLIRLRCCTGR